MCLKTYFMYVLSSIRMTIFILVDIDSITSKISLLRDILSAQDPTCIPGITVPCKLLRFTNEELNSLKPHKKGYVKMHCM